MDDVAIIHRIYSYLKDDPDIKKISIDGDRRSCEIIFTVEDEAGEPQQWVLSSDGIKEYEE